MGRGKHLSEAMKAEIIRLSGEGKSGVDIGRILSIEPSTVTSFLRRERIKKERVCEFCGKPIKDSEAVFCPYCGKKILTDADRIQALLTDINRAVCDLPVERRDKVVEATAQIGKIVRRVLS